MKSSIKGIVFSSILGIAAMVIAPFIPMVNGIVLALILGIIVTNIFTLPQTWEKGISFSSKNILEIAIIFLGFGISFQDIANLGWEIVAILILTIVVVLLATFILSKLLPCPSNIGHLVGFGTAICGSSAIAALAPKITKNKKDTGISIAVVNLLGLAGMVLFPLIFNESMLRDTAALLIGGTLHGVSNVAGAGYAIDEITGDLAITIKLGRVALLAPSLIFFNLLINRDATFKENLRLPYYLIGFIVASTIVTLVNLPPEIISGLRWFGKTLLTISMAAIGLNIHINHLFTEGRVALRFGVVIFIIQIAAVAGLAYIF